jgi:hypothetical protein
VVKNIGCFVVLVILMASPSAQQITTKTNAGTTSAAPNSQLAHRKGFNSARNLMAQAKIQATSKRTPKAVSLHVADVTLVDDKVGTLQKKLDHQVDYAANHFLTDGNKQPFYTTSVTLTPTPKIKAAAGGSDLLVNYPGGSLDHVLLKRYQAYEAYWHHAKFTMNRPLLEVSGGIATLVSVANQGGLSTKKGFAQQSDVDLSQAELAFFAPINEKFLGYLEINYESAAQEYIANDRVGNSRFYLSRGFITIGNLTQSSNYVTIGQLNAPFGKFSSGAISSPLTASLGQIRGRLIKWSYERGSVSSQIFMMRGTDTKSQSDQLNQGGFQVQQTISGGHDRELTWSVGGVRNLADAKGILARLDDANKPLAHQVSGLDIATKWSQPHWSLSFEFVKAMKAFAASDFSGAKPSAFYLESQFDFPNNRFSKKLKLGVGFGQSNQAAAFDLPKQSYVVFISGNLWPDTLQKFEYRHNSAYKSQASPKAAKDQLLLKIGVFF